MEMRGGGGGGGKTYISSYHGLCLIFLYYFTCMFLLHMYVHFFCLLLFVQCTELVGYYTVNNFYYYHFH